MSSRQRISNAFDPEEHRSGNAASLAPAAPCLAKPGTSFSFDETGGVTDQALASHAFMKLSLLHRLISVVGTTQTFRNVRFGAARECRADVLEIG
jgi:hypothetical protein